MRRDKGTPKMKQALVSDREAMRLVMGRDQLTTYAAHKKAEALAKARGRTLSKGQFYEWLNGTRDLSGSLVEIIREAHGIVLVIGGKRE